MDILDKLNIINEADVNDAKSRKAKAMGIRSIGFGRYKNASGTVYVWDKTKNDFRATGGKGGKGKETKPEELEDPNIKIDKIVEYFESRFNMVRDGATTLKDSHNNIWQINLGNRSLDKIKSGNTKDINK